MQNLSTQLSRSSENDHFETGNNFRIFAESGSSSAFGCFITSFVQLVRKADGFRNDFFAFDQRFLEAQTIFLQAVFFVVIVLVQMFHFWCFCAHRPPHGPCRYHYPSEVKNGRSIEILYHSIIMFSFSPQDFSNKRKYFYFWLKIKNVDPLLSGRFQGTCIALSEL